MESVNVLPESRNGAKYGLQVRLRSEWRQPPLFYFSPREFIVSLFVHHNEDSTVIAWSSDKDSYLPTPSVSFPHLLATVSDVLNLKRRDLYELLS